MSAVVNPASALAQLAAATETAPELVLQLGSVIDARVLAVRENIARIAVAGLVIDVLTEVALQPGADLKLAVGQTAEGGVRLAVVPTEPRTQGQASAPLPAATGGPVVSPPASAVSVQSASIATTASVSRPPAASPLQPSPETVAIAQAVGAAAPRQASLSPLFANLPVIVASGRVPGDVQTAATQLLATRPPLDATLTAGDLRQAFEKSGLFLESTLARGASPSGSPDLKAALIVFRQVLSNWLGQATLPQPAVSSQLPSSAPLQLPLQPGVQPTGLAAAPVAASTLAKIAVSVVTQAPAALDSSDVGSPVAPQARLDAATAELLRAAVQVARHEAAPVLPGQAEAADQRVPQALTPAPGQNPTARTAMEPAPPLRGAPPSPQPIASPSIVPDAPPERVAHQLLEQTDAALARQTLLQVASLPERPEPGSASQTAQPRWSFEIPFMTPQGTAVAQFEIARDGGNETEAVGPSRVWRARFSLDVEPTGPVHALITLVGGMTAVRMWAERPETAAQLRASAGGLSEALRQASLEPGDILVAEGAPPRARPKPGRFLDRAT